MIPIPPTLLCGPGYAVICSQVRALSSGTVDSKACVRWGSLLWYRWCKPLSALLGIGVTYDVHVVLLIMTVVVPVEGIP